MVSKQLQYNTLVFKRKSFTFSEGLLNPSQIENGKYDSIEHIGPWSAWHAYLDAKILVVGQDWGDVKYYLSNKGYDIDSNPTSKNLVELFAMLGIDIGLPSNPNKSAKVFLTNTILGMKDGGMSSSISAKWVNEGAKEFLAPLIEIVQPEIIITLGTNSYKAMAEIYALKKSISLKEISGKEPIVLDDGKLLFTMFHCGGLGLRNRSLNLQKEDWLRVKKYLQ
jgi:DNA polymerase